jgi:CheY-like chemotaxis protein
MSTFHSNGRTVLLFTTDDQAVRVVTHRLLQELGHDVKLSESIDDALRALRDTGAELLIVGDATPDVAGLAERSAALVNRIGDLPNGSRPREIAIFVNATHDDVPQQPRTDYPGCRVHQFFKPLHMHGLLSVLREMARNPLAGRPAQPPPDPQHGHRPQMA